MRQSVRLRVLLAVWGFWFAAALVEAPGTHACGVHAAAAGHHAAPPPAPEHAHSHHDAAPPDAPREPAECICLGHCCGVSPVAVRVAPSFSVAELPIGAAPALAPADVAPAVRRPFDRPFANGPPVA